MNGGQQAWLSSKYRVGLCFGGLACQIAMSFIDKEIIRQVVEQEGGNGLFSQSMIDKLTLLVEMETRHILESSCKFMMKDCRDVIEQDDVMEAVRDHGYVDLIVDELCGHGKDEIFSVNDDSFQEEVAMLEQLSIKQARLQGKWIYINGKVPVTDYNKEIRTLSQLQADKEQKRVLVSIIKDNPLALLTAEQAEYYHLMGQAIRENVNPKGEFTLEGDLNSLFPFFLKFLGEEPINQTGIWFLLKLVENTYIWPGLQYNLKTVLMLLLSYRGQYSYEVGVKLADIIERFEIKYPALRDIFVGYEDDSYSTLLKKIPIELKLGIVMQIDDILLEKCQQDCKKGDVIAQRFMDALVCYSSQLKHFKQLLASKSTFIYWHPCRQLRTDPYLAMF